MASHQERSTLVPGAAVGVALPGSAEGGGGGDVRARGYWEQAWIRFRRDRVALASGIMIILIVLAAFIGAPLAAHILGHGPNDINSNAVINFAPAGPFSSVKDQNGNPTYYVLGASDAVGRDEFLRVLSGARVSLEVAVFATIIGLFVGVVMGTLAGFYGGLTDTVVSRMTEIVMAFPLLLFAIGIAATVGDRLNSYTMFGLFVPGIVTLIIIISVFSWYYPARIVRAQVLSLREKEFVEAARMVGGSNFRIMRSHLLPHLVGTIIVYGTLHRGHEHPVRGGALVPRRRSAAPERELGQPALRRGHVLHGAAVADRVAGRRDPDHDAVVQPARRRHARRDRPALDALASRL